MKGSDQLLAWLFGLFIAAMIFGCGYAWLKKVEFASDIYSKTELQDDSKVHHDGEERPLKENPHEDLIKSSSENKNFEHTAQKNEVNHNPQNHH